MRKTYLVALLALLCAGMIFAHLACATTGDNDIPRQSYRISHYCACVKCCGKRADGRFANNEKCLSSTSPTIACNWLKFGTLVRIDGVVYTVRDRGAKSIFGSFKKPILAFDIFCSRHRDALNKGVYYTKKVEVLK